MPPCSWGQKCPASSILPQILRSPGHGVRRSVTGTHHPLSFTLNSYVGNSPEAEMKGSQPGNCFQEKTGWGCFQHLCSEISETKRKTRWTMKPQEIQKGDSKWGLGMSYSLLNVHTQILVVCKWNLWRVRRQICTEKQNRVMTKQITAWRDIRVQSAELYLYIYIYFFSFFPLVYSLIHLDIQFLFRSWNKQNLLPHNSNRTFQPLLRNKEMLNDMKAPIPLHWCPKQTGKTWMPKKKGGGGGGRLVIFARLSLK